MKKNLHGKTSDSNLSYIPSDRKEAQCHRKRSYAQVKFALVAETLHVWQVLTATIFEYIRGNGG